MSPQRASHRLGNRTRPSRRRRRPSVEALEPLVLMATFLVTDAGDAGPDTLRSAIEAANATAGDPDTIEFSIGGGGAATIVLASELPEITDTLTIDGATQPGFAGTPLIAIDAAGIPQADQAFGLVFFAGSDSSVVRSLRVQNFDGEGISIGWNGADASPVSGITIRGPNAADGNVVVDNDGNGRGIFVLYSGGHLVENNIVGTDETNATGLGVSVGSTSSSPAA